ncbi:MAG: FimV/HubP family polar landmark protein [Burkholderiales bacterium]
MSRLSRRAILFAGALMSLPLSAYSAGLGKLTVLSNLGEPLKAEIEVVAVEKGERDSLSARLAAVEAYIQANLPYPSGAWGLKIALDVRPNGEHYVSISSANPVSEPFVDVLVDLRWNGGRLLRAYTALLDPPVYTAQETVPPATPAPLASEPQPALPQESVSPAPTAEVPVTTAPLNEAPATPSVELSAEAAPQPAPAGEPTAASADPAASPAPGTEQVSSEQSALAQDTAPSENAPGSHATPEKAAAEPIIRTVKRGDTLGKIAREVKPADVTLEQMLVVLYRTNPDAFAGKNMNRLKTGKILRLPDPSEQLVVTPAEARKEVRVQTADWNAWRAKIAGNVDSTPALSESSQSASGAVTTKIDEKPAAPVQQPKEVLKLSKGETPADTSVAVPGGKGDTKAQGNHASPEEAAARGKAVAEAKDRAAKLENQLKDMEALLEIKSKKMADTEKSASKEVAKPAPVPAPMAEEPAKPPVAEQPAAAPAPAAVTPPPAQSEPAVTAQTTKPPAVAKKPMAPTTPPPEPTLMEKILGEPLYLAGGAGLLVLLGLGGFVAWKKRKSAAEMDDEDDEAEEPSMSPRHAEAVPEEAMAPASSAKTVGDHVSEDVDAVAEADVYLAYGRDTQAEQILKDALKSQPHRQEVHLKLLEIYHKRKDSAAFNPVAETLFAACGGKGELWRKAARMGYQLDPSNSRYAGADMSAGPSASETSSGINDKLDLDLGMNQSGESSTTDIDLGNLTVNVASADLDNKYSDPDARTQILNRTGQQNLDHTVDANAKTRQMPQMDMTADMSRTQEAKGSEEGASLDFDLDLNTLTGGAGNSKSEPGGLDLDVGRLSLDATMDGKSEPRFGSDGPSPNLPDVDLSSISLDLDGPSSSTNGTKDEHWHDVQTKFDLAKAYQEMGDKEGAREILREVVQEGDDDQKVAAEKVLEALA